MLLKILANLNHFIYGATSNRRRFFFLLQRHCGEIMHGGCVRCIKLSCLERCLALQSVRDLVSVRLGISSHLGKPVCKNFICAELVRWWWGDPLQSQAVDICCSHTIKVVGIVQFVQLFPVVSNGRKSAQPIWP